MDGRAHNVSAVLRLLLGFVVLSTVAGLLMAGLAIPAVGATGQAAKGGVNFFNDLPSEFTVSPLAQQSRILDADGKLIANPYDENRIIVPLKKISKNMQNAQIAIEDSRFYEHGGLDMRGFSRAMISNLQGGDVQGASTLTQQFVKITLQENALKRGDKDAAKAADDEDLLAQAPGAEVRAERRGELHQGPDPRGLPQPRLLRRPGLRRRGGLAQLLRRQRQQAHPRAGRPAGRHRAAADGVQPGAATPRRPRPGATSCSTGCSRWAWPAPRTSPRPRRSP